VQGLARLEAAVAQLLAGHRETSAECRRLHERLGQALKRVQELEQERAALRRQLEALPASERIEEARVRLQRLLASLDD